VTDLSQDGEQPEAGRGARRQGLAYQGAAEAVFSILIAAGIGYWADRHFGTAPRYLLIGTAVGFGSFVIRLVRLGRQLHLDSATSEIDEDGSK
jgi:F0F1-type ATP synthase assembly protein I